MKNSVMQTYWPHFKCSVAYMTSRYILDAQRERGRVHYHREFSWTVLLWAILNKALFDIYYL